MSAKVIQGSYQGIETFYGSETLTANSFIRRMRGGAQSVLLQCTNGQYFVTKMSGNPQGPNVLANELLGGIIAGECGLPVAQGRFLYLSDKFIEENVGLWFETREGRVRPTAGLHFGSAFLGELTGPGRPTDYISPRRVQAIRNRDAFLGMYIMDVWANHQDARGAIFLSNEYERGFEVRFIDHGHMFGGPHGRFSERPGVAYHPEASLYSDLWQPNAVADWISHFENVLPNALSLALSLLPLEWYKGDVSLLRQMLLHRLAHLPQLIESNTLRTRQSFQRSTTNDIRRLPHFGVQPLGAAI